MDIRPYRAALPVDEVLSIMARDAGPKLDARAFAALEAWLPDRDATLADRPRGPMSPRPRRSHSL